MAFEPARNRCPRPRITSSAMNSNYRAARRSPLEPPQRPLAWRSADARPQPIEITVA